MFARLAQVPAAALAMAGLLALTFTGCWESYSRNLVQAGPARFQLAFAPAEPATRLLLDGASGALWRLEGDQWVEVAKAPSVPPVTIHDMLGGENGEKK